MALTVNHHPTHTWDDSPTLASTRRMPMAPSPTADPFARMGWKSKTRTPRMNPCRELVKPNKTLPQPTPSVWVHGSRCRCGQEKQERESADDALAQAIETISAAYRARRKLELEAISTPAPIRPPHRQSRSSGLTSTITRILKLSSHSPAQTAPKKKLPRPAPISLTIQEIADLCNASADFDIEKVAQYLFSSSSRPHGSSSIVNTSNHLGTTPLMACLRAPSARIYPKSHLAMLTFLLDCGANPNATTTTPSQGHAPSIGLGAASVLSIACALDLPTGHCGRIIKLLLDKGAAVEVALPCSFSPRKARKQAQEQTQKGGGGGGQTAIHIATLAGNAEALHVLLSHGGADVDRAFDASSSADTSNWEPPLPAPTAAGEKVTWKDAILLTRSHHHRRTTSSNSQTSSTTTATGSTRSSAEMKVSMMRNSVTALHLAHGSPACARVLLSHGADVGVKDGYGRTPLHWAAEFGSAEVVRVLLENGAEVDSMSGMTITPLGGVVAALESGGGVAGRPGHVAVARLLTDAGAEVETNGLRERLLALEQVKEEEEEA
ncbi:ankyrin repeat-containing domain protein [Cladorrhinum sp. PSN259]|nr:ankyrin repeat-containing domain protein [Cladorrhinum sp. PSN259]